MIDKSRYKSYNPKVQDYISNVIDCLEQDYGNIPDSWSISLDLICDQYSIYIEALEDIKTRGIITKGRTGEMVKNVSFVIMDRASATIRDLLKSFALTPLSKSKMKQLDNASSLSEDDYLESLCE